MRIIRKYDNRCLYDSVLSKNVTLTDLKQYVLEGTQFKVVNAKSEADLTRQYLIQIILESELLGTPLFSQAFLEQIIRVYATPQQQWLQQYLQQAFQGLWAHAPK